MLNRRAAVMTAVIMLGIVVVMLVDTPRYSRSVQLFPWLLGLPVAAGLLVVIAAELFPRLRRWVPGMEGKGVLQMPESHASSDVRLTPEVSADGGVAEDVGEAGASTGNEREEVRRAIILSLWIVALLAGLRWLGFLPAIGLFLLLFLLFQARMSRGVALAIAGGTFAAVYLLFVEILGLRFS